MNWLKDIASKIFRPAHRTNYNSGKSLEDQYNDQGAFQYDDFGFTISYEDFFKHLKWDEITQLNAFNTDQITLDCINLEIVYGDKSFQINEDLPGWHQFILMIKNKFPTILNDWDNTIAQLPFATNYTTIYNKEDAKRP